MSASADRALVFGSRDAGRTWNAASPQQQPFAGGDPMLVYGESGTAWLSTISPGFHTWRTSDHGASWVGPATVGDARRVDDRQWLAVVPAQQGQSETVYGVAKTRSATAGDMRDDIITTTSGDAGATFTPPERIRVSEGYLQAVTGFVARLDGSVIMAYQVNTARRPDGFYQGRILARTSRDGVRYSEPTEVAPLLTYADGDARWKGLSVTPLAEDRTTGPEHGTLYMVWAAPVDGRLQIVLSRSRDGARTWSAPTRVNRGGVTSHHSSPMVAVNSQGDVAVTWHDRRDDSEDLCSRLYIAVSIDGARSFEEQRVANSPTCPGSGSRWMNGGETHGLVALSRRQFLVAWPVGVFPDLRLWTAQVSLRPTLDKGGGRK